MKKIIFIVIDGLSDKPIARLNNKTPLEKAKTDNLDLLAQEGICGLAYPFILSGQKKPESDTCHLALFGYSPDIFYLNRGPYEAVGAGLKLEPGDVALRANFATISNLKVIDRRAGRIEKTAALIKSLSKIKIKGVKIILKKSYGHRLVIVLRGKNIDWQINGNDPKQNRQTVRKISAINKKARLTARALNHFLEQANLILENHPLNKQRIKKGLLPANYLLVRGAGQYKKSLSFQEKYGLRSCCIAGGALYKGIAKVLGMKIIKMKGATGLPNTDLKAKINSVKKCLNKYDFIFLHIKATDSLAEDGNFHGKKEFIEKIDQALKGITHFKNVIIAITGDHSTCSELKKHCQELIPFLIFGKAKDRVKQFSEKACQKGDLGKINQLDIISYVIKSAGL